MANKLADRIFLEEYADHFTDTEDLVAHEGGLGKEKTSIFKKSGKGYYSGKMFTILIDMENPKMHSKLIQADGESNDKYNERVKNSMAKFAAEPEIMETQEVEYQDQSGSTRKVTTKKQTYAEIKKEKKEKEEEEKEDI